jgi:hypothetical protein
LLNYWTFLAIAFSANDLDSDKDRKDIFLTQAPNGVLPLGMLRFDSGSVKQAARSGNRIVWLRRERHLLELLEDVAWEAYCPVVRLAGHADETVTTCGLVVKQRTHHQITGEPMKFLTLADWTGMVETELFAQTCKNYGLATVRYPVLEVMAMVEKSDSENWLRRKCPRIRGKNNLGAKKASDAPAARKKRRADCKKDLQIYGAGRKSKKVPPVAGQNPSGKCLTRGDSGTSFFLGRFCGSSGIPQNGDEIGAREVAGFKNEFPSHCPCPPFIYCHCNGRARRRPSIHCR